MLNRQKIVLVILRLAGGTVSRTQLTKWAFLLAHESPNGGGGAFFDFVPYKYGPFSFSLYQEVGKLVKQGLVREAGPSRWSITRAGQEVVSKIGGVWLHDARWVLRKYGDLDADALTLNVYERYPWFTVNSEIDRRETRPIGSMAVYTAGYERLSVDAFFNGLMKTGIKRLVDVRRNPVSRRYGFHRSTLRRIGGYLDVEYTHLPELGIPSSSRVGLSSFEDYQDLLGRYEDGLLPEQAEGIESLSRLVQQTPSVLVCMEADPEWCHRSRLAAVIGEQASLPVRHLRLAA